MLLMGKPHIRKSPCRMDPGGMKMGISTALVPGSGPQSPECGWTSSWGHLEAIPVPHCGTPEAHGLSREDALCVSVVCVYFEMTMDEHFMEVWLSPVNSD